MQEAFTMNANDIFALRASAQDLFPTNSSSGFGATLSFAFLFDRI